LLWASCLTTSGCFVWGTGGTVEVEPAVLSDDYHPLERGQSIYPTPGQLAPMTKKVVVLPFFKSGAWGVELLPARSVNAGGTVSFPLRLEFADVPFLLFGDHFAVREGAVVFVQDCWPKTAIDGGFADLGSEWGQYPHDRKNSTGADQLLTVGFFPRTRQPTDETTDANKVLEGILASRPGQLMDCIEHSHYIDDHERLMVYRQLIDFMDAMEAFRKGREPHNQFANARQGINVRLDELTRRVSDSARPMN
jgi:hypothetical protein